MWGLTLWGAAGEPGVGWVPGQGLFPSRKDGGPGHWPSGTCTSCAVPGGIGGYMGATRRPLAGIQASSWPCG
jgi:hypothetical protein